MSALDALWHLLNFFAPAVFMGAFSASAARWLWRRDLRGVAWRHMLLWTVGPAAAVAVAGLVVTGRDGKIGTYVAMVLACGIGLWWRCFVRKS